jgi:hypothetical protein
MMERAGHPNIDIERDTVPGSMSAPESTQLQGFMHDGLHFSRSAYELLYNELMALIERTWPDEMPERLPFVLPRWDDEEAWKDGKVSML